MLTIDGSSGEGGGQILRSSLALSLCLQTPFRITNIRAGRKKPGLGNQHLAAVRAAAEIGSARVEGASMGSRELTFTPQGIAPGEYRFSIGTAGSTTLVLQTVLPALLTAEGPSDLVLEGGTHNPYAPPFDFLDRTFFPVIRRMGPGLSAFLDRPGFYPAGGGRIRIHIQPCPTLRPPVIIERGEMLQILAEARVAHLPEQIGWRELNALGASLEIPASRLHLQNEKSSKGPGNVVTVVVRSREITEVFTGFGERGVKAEEVARILAGKVRRYLDAGVPVGEHLADQLLLPLALAGGGEFLTLRPTLHTTTNIAVVEKFLGEKMICRQKENDVWVISHP